MTVTTMTKAPFHGMFGFGRVLNKVKKYVSCLILAWLVGFIVGSGAYGQSFDEVKKQYDNENYPAAFQGFNKLSKQGNSDAQFLLGRMYFMGLAVPQNYSKAIEYFLLSAKGGKEYGLEYIFDMFLEGQGTTNDFSEFVSLLEDGIKDCQLYIYYALGHGYYGGKVLEADLVKAHMAFNISAFTGSSSEQKESKRLRDEISEMLTQEELSQAQDLAMEEYERCL